MSRITEDNRWWCHECSTAFREPIPSVGNDPPLCPNCMSEVIEQRELDAQDDEWFHPQTEAEAEDHSDHPFMGFFNPPSMVGNRTSAPARPHAQEINPLAEMMRLMSGAVPPPSSNSSSTGSTGGGPRIRTFTFGNPTGGGIMGGATISIGGGPVLGTDEHGFVRDPWGDAFGQARGASSGPTAEQGARERFGQGGQAGFNPYRPAPGDYVTIEDLLSHFLGGMSAVGGGPGSGNLGDYVMSDEGLDRVLEQLMHAAGEHNRPPPASDVVIEGLPRIKLDETTLNASQYKDCSICLTEFELGEEVIRIPCKHIFHSECLVPWLKENGTCPVCRFSLVPQDQRNAPRPHPTGEGETVNASSEHGVGGVISNVFQGLSRFFLGGDERPHHQDEAHPGFQRTEDHRNDAAPRDDFMASRPPGSFPRPISPTVDEHPYQAIPASSSAATGSVDNTLQPAPSAEDAHQSSASLSTDNPDARPAEMIPDTSGSRFMSSVFDPRSGSPLARGNAASPGPIGTASYLGRVSSPPEQDRDNTGNTASRVDLPNPSTPNSSQMVLGHDTATATSTHPPSSPSPSTSQTQNPASDPAREQARQPSPHPVYPTSIPAEHRERHARREAMLRQAEGREEHFTGETGADHTLPE
ncbi:hypothetical protein NliqN6_1456 [Naganishia liquefaciens]|uniref:RING-type E3 ubiquitin transferase n=1 Tax=Naganishia liquefaciens TaxID=104408 RepID=A0A8H3TRR2_9TREE|nr:hypothetical protein NliqN6_1456 [Naganishia liquefaciens]